MLLREQAGEELSGLGDWWTAYQDASEDMQEQMSRTVGDPGSNRKRRNRRKPKPSSTPE